MGVHVRLSVVRDKVRHTYLWQQRQHYRQKVKDPVWLSGEVFAHQLLSWTAGWLRWPRMSAVAAAPRRTTGCSPRKAQF